MGVFSMFAKNGVVRVKKKDLEALEARAEVVAGDELRWQRKIEAAEAAASAASAEAEELRASAVETRRALVAARDETARAHAELERARVSSAALIESLRADHAQALSRMENKALAIVREESAKAAAADATVKHLSQRAVDLARERDEAVEGARQDQETAANLVRDADARWAHASEALRRIQGCPHEDAVSVFVRQTDKKTGSRAARKVGECCSRCHYVVGYQAAEASSGDDA